MRKFLLYSSALVVLGLSSVAETACIQTPSCSSLGYSSSSSCSGGVKCPFGNYWNCTGPNNTNKITELTNKITELEKQITEIINNGSGSDGATTPDYSNCKIGAILYSDKSCNTNVVISKTPIGVVFDTTNKLAVGMVESELPYSDGGLQWSKEYFDVPGLSNITSWDTVTADWQGKKNTQIVLEYCKANGKSCPAFEYVNSYKTEGTKAGDWYLPSMGELSAIGRNYEALNTALGKIGGEQLKENDYWSSSENSAQKVWYYGLPSHFGTNDKDKTYHTRVRPVLAF